MSDPGSPYIPKNLFIRRPILSSVISIVIVLLGLFSMKGLPIASYPMITPPSVSVSAFYPGATASDVAEAVAAPIEQQLSGIQDLLYYTSANGSDGTMNLSVFFNIERNQDLAAVDVQNQVKLAEPQLPQEVRQNGITVKKAQKDILLMVAVRSDDPRYDAEYLSNFLKINVEDELKKLNGVGDATVYGQLEFSMLISLDPYRMAQLHVSVPEIVAAVREQNTTNPGGRVGREPAPPGTDLTLSVTTKGRLTDAKEYEQIIIRANQDGSLLRIGDIGSVRLGARNYDLLGRLNGKATAIIPVYLRSGANALDVREAIAHRLGGTRQAVPPGRHGRHRLRHDAVRRGLDRGGAAYPRRGDDPGVPGGVHLPAELARHPHSGARRAGVHHRHLLRHADVRVLDQLDHAVRPGAGHRHRRG